jgi:cytochrome c-type biogenesis protein
MSIELAILAVVAGTLSILSPCVLPLLPAYLGVISVESAQQGERQTSVRAAMSFVGGFTAVFVAVGAVASTVGQLLRGRLDRLTEIAGAVLVLMGLRILIGSGPRTGNSWWGSAAQRVADRGTRSRASVLGAAVAIGWTPCIGPILASVLALSASSKTVYSGALLLLLYSAGLGLPFVGAALWLNRSGRALAVVRAHALAIERGGGVLLIVVGVGYLTGWWASLFGGLQAWLARTGWPPL